MLKLISYNLFSMKIDFPWLLFCCYGASPHRPTHVWLLKIQTAGLGVGEWSRFVQGFCVQRGGILQVPWKPSADSSGSKKRGKSQPGPWVRFSMCTLEISEPKPREKRQRWGHTWSPELHAGCTATPSSSAAHLAFWQAGNSLPRFGAHWGCPPRCCLLQSQGQ